MRNLKKVLSTIMAAAMLMSVVVFNASATTVSFSDKADVVNTEAVDMAVALQIINGYEDGTFRPEGNITRAEMTKMIAVLMHGGMDPVLGTNPTGASFTDVRGHWAEKYIEYCVAEGIVAGMGDGTFVPDGNVTGTQAAKMLLVALGYRADVEDFNTSNWAVRINVAAAGKKLYDKISIDPNAPLNRDDAAQMIWNALQAYEVEYVNEWAMVDGQMTTRLIAKDRALAGSTNFITLLQDKYDCTINEDVQLLGTSWDKSAKVFKYTFDSLSVLQSEVDYSDFFMMDVKVIVKKDNKTILGMVTGSSRVMAEAPKDLYDNANVGLEVDGTNYRTAGSVGMGGILVYAQNNWVDYDVVADVYLSDASIDAAYTVKLIDYDGDGRGDFVVYVPYQVGKVNTINKDSLNIIGGGVTGAMSAAASYDVDDVVIYDGIAKGDYVVVYAEANTPYDTQVIEKLEAVSGELTRTSGSTWTLDGTAYDVHALATGIGAVNLSNEYTFFVKNGFVFAKELGASNYTLDDVLMVAVMEEEDGLTSAKAKVYFAKDGSNAIITIDEFFKDGTTDTNTADDASDAANAAYGLFTFTVKNGLYTLRKLDAVNNAGFDSVTVADANDQDGITEAGSKTPGTLAGLTIADDAVIFLVNHNGAGADKFKVISGTQAQDTKEFGTAVGDDGMFEMATNTVGSRNVVQTAVVRADDEATPTFGTSSYGYVVSSIGQSRVDGSNYPSFYVYTTEGKHLVYVDDSSSSGISRGDVISFDDLGGGFIEGITVLYDASFGAAVDGDTYVGANLGLIGKTVQFSNGGLNNVISHSGSSQFTYDDDTVFLVVDSAAPQAGSYVSDAGELDRTALENAAGTAYLLNCVFTVGDNNVLELVIFDKNDEWNPIISSDASATVAMDAITTGTLSGTGAALTITGAVVGDSFTITVNNSKAVVDNFATALSSTATASMVDNGDGTYTITLADLAPAAGDTITFTVTAEDGTTTANYTITFA